jgi:hypothetical protein
VVWGAGRLEGQLTSALRGREHLRCLWQGFQRLCVDLSRGGRPLLCRLPQGARHRVLQRADAVCGEIYRLPGGGGAAAAANGRDAGHHAAPPAGASRASSAPPCSPPPLADPPGGRPAGGGALQRTPTEAQELTGLEGGGPYDADALSSGSEGGGGGGGGGGGAPDAEDEAIFDAVAAAGGLSGSARLDEDPAAASRRSSAGGAPSAGASGGGGLGHALRASLHRRRRSVTASDVASADGSHAATGAGDLAGADGAEPTYHRNHGVRVPGVAVARIEGSWLSHLNIDSTRYWTLAETKPSEWVAPPKGVGAPAAGLASDARARRDLRALQDGDRERSQLVKEEMEVEQRADRKLREAAGVFEHH